MTTMILEAPKKRRVSAQVASEIRQQLSSINWQNFNVEVQRKAAPLVQAYADARVRSRARMYHKVLR